MCQLKNCPFCGKTEALRIADASEDIGISAGVAHYVLCDASKGGCGGRGPGSLEGEDNAALQWNTRPERP